MNKKQLRQRLADMARGAGMPWDDENGYFEPQTVENLQRFMFAARDGLGFDSDSPYFGLSWLEMWGNLDTITDRLYEAMQERKR